ncbi:AIPR family protein [Anaeroarcus burkinensis]|uniref:AIPR family protein n=1 Tax=Anaeroarcus burkinensis TaxID=82376 RepID=UPI0003FE4FBB|nr:AIPR family protein [Anaeroarcus burkinensis]
MSIYHVNQIKNHLLSAFAEKINLTDIGERDPEREIKFLTRALAAYAIQYIADVNADIAGKSITDGSDDNGIDAIYYDERARLLYLVQSKWISNGNSEPNRGDVKKFIDGMRDLYDLKFDRFNDKVRAKQDEIKKAMSEPNTKCKVILVHTGKTELASHATQDFDDFLAEMNDTSEVVLFTKLNQKSLHDSLALGVTGDPIDISIGLKYWGRILEPHKAFYGQVNGVEIAQWWETYRSRLFSKNLRGMLGETEVNDEITKTLDSCPQHFWYFNNGITIVCDNAEKTMAGGADRDFGQFKCSNISIVNGAQTVSSIGKFGEKNIEKLKSAYIPVRVISLQDCEPNFGEQVTKTNNRQNRIDNRDFVSLDPEQNRIKTELAIEGITYHVARSEGVDRTKTAFDLVESTTALACASRDVSIVVQLKREIGRLWENISKSPYRTLFNPQVSGDYIWNAVQYQRIIDKCIEKIVSEKEGRDYSIAVHGNRIISLLVFEKIRVSKDTNSLIKNDLKNTEEEIASLVKYYYCKLKENIDLSYSNAILPTLFKNKTKCEDLVQSIKSII